MLLENAEGGGYRIRRLPATVWAAYLLACTGAGGAASSASARVQGQSSTTDFSTRTSLSNPSASTYRLPSFSAPTRTRARTLSPSPSTVAVFGLSSPYFGR